MRVHAPVGTEPSWSPHPAGRAPHLCAGLKTRRATARVGRPPGGAAIWRPLPTPAPSPAGRGGHPPRKNPARAPLARRAPWNLALAYTTVSSCAPLICGQGDGGGKPGEKGGKRSTASRCGCSLNWILKRRGGEQDGRQPTTPWTITPALTAPGSIGCPAAPPFRSAPRLLSGAGRRAAAAAPPQAMPTPPAGRGGAPPPGWPV